MKSIFKIVLLIGILIILSDISKSQDVKWLENNFKKCIKLDHDRLFMKAAITNTINKSYFAKSAMFQVHSKDGIIMECLLSGLDKDCKKEQNEDCYCESKSASELIVVYIPIAKSSFIGKNVTVMVPCVDIDTCDPITSLELNITSSNDTITSPSLRLNNKEINLSKEIVNSKVPALLTFCCDISRSPLCHAHMTRNNLRIDNGSHCVSFNETSSSYESYTMHSTMCNQTSDIMNIIFFSIKELDEDKKIENSNVLGYCTLEIVLFTVLILIVTVALNLRCPGCLKHFSVHSQGIKVLDSTVSTLKTDMETSKYREDQSANEISTLKEDLKNINEKNKALENIVSTLTKDFERLDQKVLALSPRYSDEEINKRVDIRS